MLGSFASLFFLLISYYFVKPVLKSQFLGEFAPSTLPVLYICVSLVSLAVTKLFNQLFQWMSRRRLILVTFLAMMVPEFLFAAWLLHDGMPETLLCDLWGSTNFLRVWAAGSACI